jgi:hypothetical protein
LCSASKRPQSPTFGSWAAPSSTKAYHSWRMATNGF